MAEITDFLDIASDNDINNMRCSKPFFGADNGRKEHLGIAGAINPFAGTKTNVTGVAVIMRVVFSEVVKEASTTAD